jgi:hypothetical protein
VLGIDECRNNIQTRQVQWHGAAVITIAEEESFSGELVDLSVDEDETYVAGGIIVHNCRTVLYSINARTAKRMGITSPKRLTKEKPAEGFGHADPLEWQPDLKGIPSPLKTAYRAKKEKPPKAKKKARKAKE